MIRFTVGTLGRRGEDIIIKYMKDNNINSMLNNFIVYESLRAIIGDYDFLHGAQYTMRSPILYIPFGTKTFVDDAEALMFLFKYPDYILDSETF